MGKALVRPSVYLFRWFVREGGLEAAGYTKETRCQDGKKEKKKLSPKRSVRFVGIMRRRGEHLSVMRRVEATDDTSWIAAGDGVWWYVLNSTVSMDVWI